MSWLLVLLPAISHAFTYLSSSPLFSSPLLSPSPSPSPSLNLPLVNFLASLC
ncbi:hypothetical protein KC19_4G164500 [Ceratodon purpureus]|uniref:Uncharacterized protein n=1 Tax=Ceratodon purpureus TaxID=3225 RepID=A0A8T0IBV8_CERPU|nr:hypothetical protein KC19_4G164500 [Ceratodon purpureus]